MEPAGPAAGKDDTQTKDPSVYDGPPLSTLIPWEIADGRLVYRPVEVDSISITLDGDIRYPLTPQIEAALVDVTAPESAAVAPKALAKSQAFLLTTAIANAANSWPNQKICYEIVEDSRRRWPEIKKGIQIAIREWNANSDMPFVKEDCYTQGSFTGVKFQMGYRNRSYIGNQHLGTNQIIELSENLLLSDFGGGDGMKGAIMHEMGHTAGLFHEHQRPDRDQFVKIWTSPNLIWAYDTPEWQENYAIKSGKTWSSYDVNSLMQYPTKVLTYETSKGTFTVDVKKKDGSSIPQNKSLSFVDKSALNYMGGYAGLVQPTTGLPMQSTATVVRADFTGGPKIFLVQYDVANGNATISEYNTVTQSYSQKDKRYVGANYNTIRIAHVDGQLPALYFYALGYGNYSFWHVNATGVLNPSAKATGTMSATWDNTEFFKMGSKTYMVRQQGKTRLNSYLMYIKELPNTYTFPAVNTYSGQKDWDFFKFFELEGSSGLKTQYMVTMRLSGSAEIFRTTSAGSIEATPVSTGFFDAPDMMTAYSTNEEAYMTFAYYNKTFLVSQRITRFGTFDGMYRNRINTYAFMGKIRMLESASLFRENYPTGVATAPHRAENVTLLGFTDAPKALIGRGFPFF